MRLLLLLLAGTTLTASAPSPQNALLRARAEAREAANRVTTLERRAAVATSRATRARAAQNLAVARIAAAEAGISAAEARVRIVEGRRAAQRARLAAEERPTVTLIAGLQTLARRPPALALVQPGSLQDLVRTRALLASTLPAVAARTRTLRAELAAATRIERDATAAAAALRAGRANLDAQRTRLAALEAVSLRQSQSFIDAALGEGDRALAMDEDARTIVSRSRQRQRDAAVLRALSTLPEPRLRPGTGPREPRSGTRPTYLLPADGRVLIGAGEISAAGVHARGTTLGVAPGAAVVAPAAGRVVYAALFRSYGGVVIVDHGGGWTTTVTDLRSLDVASGASVARGEMLGAARRSRPEITVELRRAGRPVPIASVL